MTRYKKRKIIISVCIVLILALIGVGIWQLIEYINIDPTYKKIMKFPIVYKMSDDASDEIVETELLAKVTPWDELSITNQYSELDFDGVRYSSRNKEISTDMLLDKIGDYTACGTDMINDIKYTKNAEVYSVKDISSECVVAVKLQGVEACYAYTNPFYKPETLGDFINDLNLKELLSFGTVSYNYDEIKGKTYINERVEFTDVTDETIWQKLLYDTTLKNVHSDEKFYESTVISIRVDADLLGYENIGLWITEDGYMHTNILDTGKTFYIGKEKLDEFTNYLLDNCYGERYVYTTVDETLGDTGDYAEIPSVEVKGS